MGFLDEAKKKLGDAVDKHDDVPAASSPTQPAEPDTPGSDPSHPTGPTGPNEPDEPTKPSEPTAPTGPMGSGVPGGGADRDPVPTDPSPVPPEPGSDPNEDAQCAPTPERLADEQPGPRPRSPNRKRTPLRTTDPADQPT